MISLEEARQVWFPHAKVANLNAGTTSPTPLPVLEVASHWREKLSRDPVGVIWLAIIEEIETQRTALAEYLSVSSSELLLLHNTTMGINTVAQSLTFSPNDEILLTDQEYHHYEPLWQRVCRRTGAKLRRVHLPRRDDTTPDEIIALFEKAWSPHTTLLFTSHVTSQTGTALPVAELCRIARERGTRSLIDGAHAPGLVPVNPTGLDCDFYAGNVHKWLMGAVGSAFLYVRSEARNTIVPLVVTGESEYAEGEAHDRKADRWPTFWQYAFEYQGTQDRSALTAIAKALDLRRQLGEEQIQKQVLTNRQRIREHLRERQMTCLSPDHSDLATAMMSVCLPASVDRVKAWVWMREQGYDVAFPNWDQRIMRISAAWFVTAKQIDDFFATFDRCPLDTLSS